MASKGNHTWELNLRYHCCPQCRRIVESRDAFRYELGRYVKDVHCPYCDHTFTLYAKVRPSFAPLFGEPSLPEVDWPQ